MHYILRILRACVRIVLSIARRIVEAIVRCMGMLVCALLFKVIVAVRISRTSEMMGFLGLGARWRARWKISKLLLLDVLPRALGMFFGTTHTSREVFQTIHMQSATSIAGRQNSFPPLKIIHTRNHLRFERTTVVPFVMAD